MPKTSGKPTRDEGIDSVPALATGGTLSCLLYCGGQGSTRHKHYASHPVSFICPVCDMQEGEDDQPVDYGAYRCNSCCGDGGGVEGIGPGPFKLRVESLEKKDRAWQFNDW